MKRFLSIAMALCIGLTMSLDANAAKRFGGGKSSGAAPTHQTSQMAPSSAAGGAAATAGAAGAAGAATKASGASRWLGPLAGIAAGGLLASMFMGDGFQGMQIFDILIMAVIAFLVFRFIAARRRKQQEHMAPAGAPMQREVFEQKPTAMGSIFGGSAAPAAARPVINAPAWFNEHNFIEAARNHFQSLQQHWDANEMDKIAEFVTPQLLEFLKRERADLGDGFQSTYIDNLQVQLDGVDDRADKTIATLTFSGVSKSSRFDQGEVFSESWNMERPQGENQPWLVAGIRQNG
ncbi:MULTISPECIES: Tim44 domain-containing protein [Gammaproteobacteria]|uniref:Tim44 domain-containing protein n=1 Tax=Gammaproteobacteria TaxID=1236 RepID=UPI0019116812|nr:MULTISPECIES: Tim44 domain-containing protein [Gammaproteobacteria]MBK5302549.1 Tim44 domain-containing protein [Bacillus sp. TH86]MBK5322318.1 Tim44 domain-containing protein [Bacillus sp. TH59]MBK5337268.1 Tim44 domain-containing protein [Bacillus sp. TH57]MBK5311327.1 Tim44 domain-containing protein [Pseudomonas sp. TH71]MBK5316815.1 Tim44 domain-containing protein [Erwinia sp. TH79]